MNFILHMCKGLAYATIEKEFNYKNCCNDDEGLSELRTSKLIPSTCSERSCFYSSAMPFAIWTSKQVLPGCECCEVNGTLVPEGHSWEEFGKNFLQYSFKIKI